MKGIVFTLLIVFTFTTARAQYTLRLIVNEVATKPLDDIYVAGSFNGWNPKDEKYKLKPYGTTRRAIILKDITAGTYEFKFTRGVDKWETNAKGQDIANRSIVVKEDVAADFTIKGWKDDYPDKPKPNTATAQVRLIDTAFLIPQLNRKRRVWAYIPKSYATSAKKYPVIYMQDGQNLFNEQTAGFGEWGVDEALDTISKKTGKEAIIIGIDHGGDKRLNEYNPFDHPKYGKGEGKEYADFVALTLKPVIDKKFRTLKDPQNTFIAGSSMGALISMYAVVRHPNVFGGAGIFSPAFWIAPTIYDTISAANWNNSLKKFYFYAGGKESEAMIYDMDKVLNIVEKKGTYETRRLVNPIAKHNEAAWRKEFVDFYNFIIR